MHHLASLAISESSVWPHKGEKMFFAFLFPSLALIWLTDVSSGFWQTAQQLELEEAAGGEQSFAASAWPTWPRPSGSPRPAAQQAWRTPRESLLQGLKVSPLWSQRSDVEVKSYVGDAVTEPLLFPFPVVNHLTPINGSNSLMYFIVYL